MKPLRKRKGTLFMLIVKRQVEPLRPVHQAFHSLCYKRRTQYTPQTKQIVMEFIKEEPRSKIYGGIICTVEQGKKEYALVQGRHTGKWSFPKGHSNEGETPMECTKREIYEETGISVLPEPIEYMKVGYGYYYVFILSTKCELVPYDTNEIMNTAWVTIEEMGKMTINADVNQYVRNYMRRYKP